MASFEDEEDFTPENTVLHQTTWRQQLQRQRAELQIRNPTIAASRPRHFNVGSASDDETGKLRLPPGRQFYHPRVNSSYSGGHGSYNPVSGVDNRRVGATQPVDYVRLNRHQLKGHNNRKFIYPPKTYTEMFHKKSRLTIGYRGFSRTSGYSGKFFISFLFCSYVVIYLFYFILR